MSLLVASFAGALSLGCASGARAVGGGVMGVGACTALVGAGEATGVRFWEYDWSNTEATGAGLPEIEEDPPSGEPNPELGAPLVFAGLGAVVAGGVIYGLAGGEDPSERRRTRPAPKPRRPRPGQPTPRPMF